MPVYNGADTIATSIESLLGQTFGDFELIVSDNASTDATGDVVAELIRQDPRIRYVRHPENIGANSNYSYVAKAARGEFVKWASASDLCAPRFLERCVQVLSDRDDAVLAVPRTRLFVGDIDQAEDYQEDIAILDETPFARLLRMLADMRLNNAMNGLIRTRALLRTRLIEPYSQADIVLMGHLAMLGKFILIDEPMFYRRMEESSATLLQDAAARVRHHYPRQSARMLLQEWKRLGGWFKAVVSAPMPAAEKLHALTHVARMGYWQKEALVADLGGVWRYARGNRA